MYLKHFGLLLSIRSAFCDFLPVQQSCKYWSYLNVYGNGETKKMHCILDQDFQPGIVYTEWKIISNGTCPIYNRFAKEIDTIPCDDAIGICPNDIFPSYSGVTFTGCYDAIMKQTNMKRPTGNEDTHAPSTTSDQQIELKRPTGNENTHAPPSTSERIALIVVATLFGITICINVFCCYVGIRGASGASSKINKKHKDHLSNHPDTRETSRGTNKEPGHHLPLLPAKKQSFLEINEAKNRLVGEINVAKVPLNAPDCTSGEQGNCAE